MSLPLSSPFLVAPSSSDTFCGWVAAPTRRLFATRDRFNIKLVGLLLTMVLHLIIADIIFFVLLSALISTVLFVLLSVVLIFVDAGLGPIHHLLVGDF